MRCLLKPIIISELGQVILKPGADLMSLFGDRVMVTRVPPEFRKMPSGALPTVEQQLATDPRSSRMSECWGLLVAPPLCGIG